ncbi:Arc family DNA-binding protein [Vibrio cholerae]|nr:Arc family DNA-binding protein [Vibrio mimicus]EJL6947035.1 Arc family DNA-binding protein [Vibrio cholerae]EJS3366022.1 Arc family DNA-binding protein [Vibrio cholerae]EKA4530343.1 Arc family DNA-binding protein [Vibrio cholerae]EKF9203498.1 Arc family DNA-binding protein [Vibrio cholerae]ELU8570823.1 Arc family DNA-binding protein [Vibrio cholerae]
MKTEVPLQIRLPKELLDWLTDTAAKDRRSRNAEIVYLLEQTKEQQEKANG